MAGITLQVAVKDIADTLRRAKDNGRPATLLIGAGVSRAGGIPLAGELVAQIKKEFASRDGVRTIDPKDAYAYGKAMQCLAPNEQRDLLRPHFTKAKVNWANVAVAQLLARDLIGSVLTVNFDPLLARACALVGVHPAIYDFSQSKADENLLHLARPSIVHLHGQSNGFVLLNSKDETDKHRGVIAPVIKLTVQQAPLVVLGYSGGADGVFATLAECYRGDERLYWLGYEDAPNADVAAFLARSTCAFAGKADADRVLIDLAAALSIWPPKAFRAPIVHLLDSLETLTAYPAGGEGPATFDLLASHRANLQRMRDAESQREKRIGELTTAYFEGKHEDVVSGVEALQAAGGVDASLLLMAYWSAISLGVAQGKSGDLAAAARWEEMATKYSDKPHDALYNWGIVLRQMASRAEGAEQARLFAEACAKYARAVEIKPDQHEALNNWGVALSEMAKRAEGAEQVRLFNEACAKYARAVEIKPDQHEALNNWGNVLLQWAQRAETAEQRAALYEQAAQKLMAAERIKPGAASYNLACLMALNGQPDPARDYLLAAHAHGRLPTRAKLETDTDLDAVRTLPWFQEILALADGAAAPAAKPKAAE